MRAIQMEATPPPPPKPRSKGGKRSAAGAAAADKTVKAKGGRTKPRGASGAGAASVAKAKGGKKKSAAGSKRKGGGGLVERSANVDAASAAEDDDDDDGAGAKKGGNKRRKTGKKKIKTAATAAEKPATTAAKAKTSSRGKNKKRKQRDGDPEAETEAATASAPVLTDADKVALAEERYADMLSTDEEGRNDVVTVISSSLSDYDQDLIKVMAKEVKKSTGAIVKFAKDFQPTKTSVLITPLADGGGRANSSNRGGDSSSSIQPQLSQYRTAKAMRAALAGVPIVSPGWISACLREKRVVPPGGELCARSLPTKAERFVPAPAASGEGVAEPSPALAVSNYAALLRRREQQPSDGEDDGASASRVLPLEGVHVIMCGQWRKGAGAPKKSDALTLLRDTGATVLSSAGAAAKTLKAIGRENGDGGLGTVVLLCDETKADPGGIVDPLFRAAEACSPEHMLAVNCNWLFDCISCGSVLGADEYRPASPRARSLWKLCTGR